MKKMIWVLCVTLLVSLLMGMSNASAEIGHNHITELSIQQCPVCNMSGYFTGTTKVDWGQLFYLYECPNGHRWWSKQP